MQAKIKIYFQIQNLELIIIRFYLPKSDNAKLFTETNPCANRFYKPQYYRLPRLVCKHSSSYISTTSGLKFRQHLSKSSGCTNDFYLFFAMPIYQAILTIDLTVLFSKYVPCQHFRHVISFARRLPALLTQKRCSIQS